MRLAACSAGAVAVLLAACAGVPAEQASVVAGNDGVQFLQVDGENVCSFGGLLRNNWGCPESITLTPGDHRITAAYRHDGGMASDELHIDAQAQAKYRVNAAWHGYNAVFRIDKAAD
jgi:hypothetical protein